MVAVRTTTLVAAAALASTLMGFGFRAEVSATPQDAPKAKTVWDGVYSKDQAARGQAKYQTACSNCHQGDLSGSDQAPSLAGGDFTDRWDGQSVGDLADRI